METLEIQAAIEDLETRAERLRALYEQYFMGIEKIEPQIPRKEVERRIALLRREQIRNTALRFKFQTLVQRYNTMQQYWMRITREIENGTYRRDVARAAQRFGEKEALTILGRKKARLYANLAARQASHSNDEAVELSAEDFVEEVPAAPAIAPTPEESVAHEKGPLFPNSPRPTLISARPAPAKTEPPLAPSLGLRWTVPAEPVSGVRASGDDAKLRVLALAAAMKAQKTTGDAVTNPGALDLELDLAHESGAPMTAVRICDTGPLVSQVRAREPPRFPAVATGIPTADVRKGMLGRLDLPFDVQVSSPEESEPLDSGSPASSVRATRTGITPHSGDFSALRPAPGPVGSQPRAQPAAALPGASGGSTLPDQRIRQIYASFVEARRTTRESTAGVTFEKLAASLRAQVDKLKAAHPTKAVDYEVVIKEGKAHLKPIIR